MMMLIRRFEEEAARNYAKGKIGGFLHLYIGQEAIAVAAAEVLEDHDYRFQTYRDHGIALARGMSADAAMAELFGKDTGCSRGLGGSMHFFDVEHHFYGGHGIVGGQIPVAVGLGFAAKYKETGNVAVGFFGDGAINQGAFHEAANLASLYDIPVLLCCENNAYGMGTSVERSTAQPELYKQAYSYDMTGAVMRWPSNSVFETGNCPSQMLHFTSPNSGISLPQGNVTCSPRDVAAYSHSASVGKRAPLHVA